MLIMSLLIDTHADESLLQLALSVVQGLLYKITIEAEYT